MEIKLENIKTNEWEFTTTLSSEDIVGITGPEYEELLQILSLKELPDGEIIIDNENVCNGNHYEYYK